MYLFVWLYLSMLVYTKILANKRYIDFSYSRINFEYKKIVREV